MGFSVNGVTLMDLLEEYHKLAKERDLTEALLEARVRIMEHYISEGKCIPSDLITDIAHSRSELAAIKDEINGLISAYNY